MTRGATGSSTSVLLSNGAYQQLRVATLSIAISLLFLSSVFGQIAPNIDERGWSFRYDLFELLLQQKGLEVQTDSSSVLASPTESTIVMIGQVEWWNSLDWDDLRRFVEDGGRVLLASDRFLYVPEIAVLNAGPVRTRVPRLQFQGFDDCLLIDRLSKENNLTASLNTLVANRSGWIASKNPSLTWEDLVLFPGVCIPEAAANMPLVSIGRAKEVESGRIVLHSDPSMLSNGMLWFANNGEFANRLAVLLAEDNRRSVLFVVDTVPLPAASIQPNSSASRDSGVNSSPPKPRLDTLLQVANAAVRELAIAETLNRQLKDRPRNVRPNDYAMAIWMGMASCLLGIVGVTLWKRSASMLPHFGSRRMRNARELAFGGLSNGTRNKIAAESLAREFSRRWTGGDSVSDWRIFLDQLKHERNDDMSSRDRMHVESLLAIAIFGGKLNLSDQELVNIGESVRHLTLRYRPENALLHNDLPIPSAN